MNFYRREESIGEKRSSGRFQDTAYSYRVVPFARRDIDIQFRGIQHTRLRGVSYRRRDRRTRDIESFWKAGRIGPTEYLDKTNAAGAGIGGIDEGRAEDTSSSRRREIAVGGALKRDTVAEAAAWRGVISGFRVTSSRAFVKTSSAVTLRRKREARWTSLITRSGGITTTEDLRANATRVRSPRQVTPEEPNGNPGIASATHGDIRRVLGTLSRSVCAFRGSIYLGVGTPRFRRDDHNIVPGILRSQIRRNRDR